MVQQSFEVIKQTPTTYKLKDGSREIAVTTSSSQAANMIQFRDAIRGCPRCENISVEVVAGTGISWTASNIASLTENLYGVGVKAGK